MTAGPLRTKLESCYNDDFNVTGFTIGHRGGGTLQFPEETVQCLPPRRPVEGHLCGDPTALLGHRPHGGDGGVQIRLRGGADGGR